MIPLAELDRWEAESRAELELYGTPEPDTGQDDEIILALIAEVRRLRSAHTDATALLEEYADRGRDIIERAPGTLMGRTRALLAALKEVS